MKQLTVLVALAGTLTGCGPLRSTANILDAEVQIQAARTAEAEQKAPYEWTAANLYIQKAREEVAYSDYQAGVNFAVKASKFANEARERAMASGGTEPSPSSTDSPRPSP
ncbi:DUF4398 domain-containing protein [Hyalangium sp.]|uniref:DUF4398 domain-containing protein n=1 Tax=Hyalangium sp. TaxID=2028555 RepID=UPI002D483015|nr:DUF4398 domain-containing protein [Hyalangium sp.]HYH97389.1 DUF4398 domain-containing protein [Hyalangium sp.]